MKLHNPKTVGQNLSASYEGIALALTPEFTDPDIYEHPLKHFGDYLEGILHEARDKNYVIDFIEIQLTHILVHHRKLIGSLIPKRPTLVFQYKFPEEEA